MASAEDKGGGIERASRLQRRAFKESKSWKVLKVPVCGIDHWPFYRWFLVGGLAGTNFL